MTTTPPIERDLAELFRASRSGDGDAKRALFAALYDDVRRLAASCMARERADHTLAPTSLAHEVFLRIDTVGLGAGDRTEFLRLVAAVMRRVLIDSARRRHTGRRVLEQRVQDGAAARRDERVVRLDDALSRLGECDAELLRVVELRFLCGLGVPEVASTLGVSTATVKRDWRTARAFLQAEIERDA